MVLVCASVGHCTLWHCLSRLLFPFFIRSFLSLGDCVLTWCVCGVLYHALGSMTSVVHIRLTIFSPLMSRQSSSKAGAKKSKSKAGATKKRGRKAADVSLPLMSLNPFVEPSHNWDIQEEEEEDAEAAVVVQPTSSAKPAGNSRNCVLLHSVW